MYAVQGSTHFEELSSLLCLYIYHFVGEITFTCDLARTQTKAFSENFGYSMPTITTLALALEALIYRGEMSIKNTVPVVLTAHSE